MCIRDSLRTVMPQGSKRVISGKIEKYKDSYQMTHPHHVADINQLENLRSIETIYPLTGGLRAKPLRNAIISSLNSIGDLPEWISLELLKKKKWEPWSISLKLLHNPKEIFNSVNSLHLERLAFDELLSHQLTIRLIKQKIKKIKGNELKSTNFLISKLFSSG